LCRKEKKKRRHYSEQANNQNSVRKKKRKDQTAKLEELKGKGRDFARVAIEARQRGYRAKKKGN